MTKETNGRVTTKEFYELQLKMMDRMLSKREFKEFREELREVLAKIDGIPELAKENKGEINRLRGESNVIKVMGALVTVILGMLGFSK